MRAKRLDIRAVFAGVALAAVAMPAAQAQLVDGKWRATGAASGSARGVATTPQPQVVVVQPSSPYGGTVFRRRAGTHYPTPAYHTVIPAVITPNGMVYANFGFGYEPVYRSCSGAVVVGQPSVVASNGVVLQPARPTYTQPVPNQQTASQQMLSANQSRNVVVNQVQSSCYSRDAYGRVFAYRF